MQGALLKLYSLVGALLVCRVVGTFMVYHLGGAFMVCPFVGAFMAYRLALASSTSRTTVCGCRVWRVALEVYRLVAVFKVSWLALHMLRAKGCEG